MSVEALSVDWELSTFKNNFSVPDISKKLSRNVGDYQSALRNAPEEQRFHLPGGTGLKAHVSKRVPKKGKEGSRYK